MTRLLRKIVVCSLLGVSLFAPALPSAQAHVTGRTHSHYYRYRVYYRHDCHCPWIYYRACDSLIAARGYADWLYTSYGYETYVR
ncbi:MAG: hypothetical protein U0793_16685 [Gemmataceae bacterium]